MPTLAGDGLTEGWGILEGWGLGVCGEIDI